MAVAAQPMKEAGPLPFLSLPGPSLVVLLLPGLRVWVVVTTPGRWRADLS